MNGPPTELYILTQADAARVNAQAGEVRVAEGTKVRAYRDEEGKLFVPVNGEKVLLGVESEQ